MAFFRLAFYKALNDKPNTITTTTTKNHKTEPIVKSMPLLSLDNDFIHFD